MIKYVGNDIFRSIGGDEMRLVEVRGKDCKVCAFPHVTRTRKLSNDVSKRKVRFWIHAIILIKLSDHRSFTAWSIKHFFEGIPYASVPESTNYTTYSGSCFSGMIPKGLDRASLYGTYRY